ncbi:MAG TPA: antibiotic biosynthesis monooxygenase family protein [Bacteroidota bacterium]
MFMRLLQVHAKSDSISSLPILYTNSIIPELRKARGCLYGGLIQSVRHPEECISMTLWESPEHAESYEQSGLFQKLLKQAENHLSESLEWRVQLSKDMTLDYSPVQDEPVVRSFRVTAASSPETRALDSQRLYVRILSIKLLPGKLEEFARLYNEQIIPALRNVQGCRYAFLTEGIEERNEVFSVTIWDRKEDADQYEATGIFDNLKRKVSHTFSELYQWKLAADRGSHSLIATSEDMVAQGYNVVSGRSYQ